MRMTSALARMFGTRLAGLAVCAATVGTLPARAQDREPPKKESDYTVPFTHFYGVVGRINGDPSGINSHFVRPDVAGGTGFSALSNDAYAIGLGGYVPFQRMIAGFEAYYADFGYETSPQGKTNRAETAFGMATIGFPLFTSWRMTAFPYVGVGAGSMRVTLKNRDGGATVSLARSPTFDEIILSPGAESQIMGSYFLLQPGVGFDYLVLSDDNTSHMGVTFGLRFGTMITPNRTVWKYRGKEVFGGPTFQPTGGTLRILVGIGGFKMAAHK